MPHSQLQIAESQFDRDRATCCTLPLSAPTFRLTVVMDSVFIGY
jgi:hypothetical protein